MLWKKDSKRKTAMYVDYFGDMETDLFDTAHTRTKTLSKSNAISDRLREEGNIEFAARNWENAIKAYNYALCFAENGSEAVSRAYAYRSSCFYELKQFDSCRADMELALHVPECSESIKQILIQLQKDYANLTGNNDSIESNVRTPKMDFEPNISVSCFANVLQLERQTEFGYQITAKSDIDVGQRIFMEKSIVSTLINDQYMRCSVCLTRSNNLIPCSSCTKAMFCDNECQGNILHAAECGMSTEMEGDGKLAFLIRTVLYAKSVFHSTHDLMNFVENSIGKVKDLATPLTDAQMKYQNFLRLKCDRMIASGEKHDIFIYFAYQAIMASKVGDSFASKRQQRFLIHLIWQHEAIISLGSVHQYTNEYGQADSLHLFPTFSQFNHSCTPNAMFYVVDDWSVIITMRPIKKGQEVTISYFGRICYPIATVEQQEYVERLRDIFGIKCQCDLCENRTSSVKEQTAMRVDPFYQSFLQSFKQEEIDGTPLKQNAIEFLRKFGHLKWCAELSVVTACFMDIIWKQIESGDLD